MLEEVLNMMFNDLLIGIPVALISTAVITFLLVIFGSKWIYEDDREPAKEKEIYISRNKTNKPIAALFQKIA